jgi:4-hydroxy-3-methylbut-2-en-1-yl diphosphate synthase IspG/GcpE
MNLVKLVSKCGKHMDSWVNQYDVGNMFEMSDSAYEYHKVDGCVEVIKHYEKKKLKGIVKCPTCGRSITKYDYFKRKLKKRYSKP